MAMEEVKAAVELLATVKKEVLAVVKNMLTRVEMVLEDVEVDKAEEEEQEIEETEDEVEGVDEANVEEEADKAEGTIINVYNYFLTAMLAYSRSQTRVDHLVIKLHVTPMAFYIYGEGDYQLGTKIQKSMK